VDAEHAESNSEYDDEAGGRDEIIAAGKAGFADGGALLHADDLPNKQFNWLPASKSKLSALQL